MTLMWADSIDKLAEGMQEIPCQELNSGYIWKFFDLQSHLATFKDYPVHLDNTL